MRHGIIRGLDSALAIAGDQVLYVIGVRGVPLGELRCLVLRKIRCVEGHPLAKPKQVEEPQLA